MSETYPSLNVCLSPSLLNCYDITKSIVVIIDILRATSTIVVALGNGAKEVIPVKSIGKCISLGKEYNAITAGERNGKIIKGLKYGNSPFDFSNNFIKDKTLIITTTNGTKLIDLSKKQNANEIIIGSFLNLNAIVNYLKNKKKNILLACAAWKDRINIEDMLFAGAVVNLIKNDFEIKCDSAFTSEIMYLEYLKNKSEFITKLTHYNRLMKYGLKKDIDYCFMQNEYNIVPIYDGFKLQSCN